MRGIERRRLGGELFDEPAAGFALGGGGFELRRIGEGIDDGEVGGGFEGGGAFGGAFPAPAAATAPPAGFPRSQGMTRKRRRIEAATAAMIPATCLTLRLDAALA